MSSGLHVDFAQAKIEGPVLETHQVEAQSILEPGVDSERSQGGPFVRGNEQGASHLEDPSGSQVATFNSRNNSEDDEAKTLGKPKVVAEEFQCRTFVVAEKIDLSFKVSQVASLVKGACDPTLQVTEENQAKRKVAPVNSTVKVSCDQKFGEAHSSSHPRATAPLLRKSLPPGPDIWGKSCERVDIPQGEVVGDLSEQLASLI
jgi:hypothetical protein